MTGTCRMLLLMIVLAQEQALPLSTLLTALLPIPWADLVVSSPHMGVCVRFDFGKR